MGLFSGIKKAVKKIVKGVGKVFKKVVKEVKNFASSNFGKLAIAALVIYTGGVLTGAWEAPAFMSSTATTTAATETATAVDTVAKSAQVADTVTKSAQVADTVAKSAQVADTVAKGTQVADVAAVLETGAAPTEIANVLEVAGKEALKDAAGKGLMSQIGGAIKGAGAWMAENPMLTLVGGNLLQSAFAPNEVDEQLRLEKERLNRQNVAGVMRDGTDDSKGLIETAYGAPAVGYQAPNYSGGNYGTGKGNTYG